ncbi:DUF4079 domain-containing protein [Desulfovibrio aminophilus]|uniref:DUF4079 domain-containing protein n=1 Tax=Desulfovibrio aminophilus TaxID=81425 RepID=UPI003394117D
MPWLHPIFQTLALLLSVFVLLLGWTRFATVYLGRAGQFQWKRHVTLGTLVLLTWLGGFFAGLGVAWLKWQAVFFTGPHHRLALVMLPLILFGLISGLIMDRNRKKRRWLPLVHGLNNALLVPAGCIQLASGLLVLRDYVLP